MNYLLCQELNIFLESAGKPQKSLTASYGMSDERGSQLRTAAGIQMRDRETPITVREIAIKAAVRGPLKRVHWVWKLQVVFGVGQW